MNILNKLTIKHLKLNKKRTIVTIIGIILSTALMVGIGTLFSSFREFLVEQTIANSGKQHATIKNINYDKYKYIKNNLNVKESYLYYPLGYSKLEKGTNEYKPYLFTLYANEEYLKSFTLIKGELPKNENEVVISNHIMTNGGVEYKIGDTLSLEIGDRYGKELIYDESGNSILSEEKPLTQQNPLGEEERLEIKYKKEYKIVGIIERIIDEPYSAPGYTIVSKINEKNISKDQSVNVGIIYKDISDTIKKTEKICNEISSDGQCEIDYNNSLLSLSGESTYSDLNNTLIGIITVILVLITVGCAIVIYNSFAISVMERKKQFGLFSSIGATKIQLRKTVFYEAFIVSLIGIPIGILSGIFGIYIVLKITNALLPTLFNGTLNLALYPTFIILPIIYMIVTIIISAYLPSKQAAKISPIEAIRLNDDIKVNKRKIRTNKWVRKLFGIEGELALKNIKRNKKKYRITILSLFVSIVLFISFSTFLEYGNTSSEDFLNIQDFDIIASAPNSSNQKVVNQIVKINGIDDYTIVKSLNGNIDIPKNKLTKKALEKINDTGFEFDNNGNFNANVSIYSIDNNSYERYIKDLNLNYNNFKGETFKPILVNTVTYKDNETRATEHFKPFNYSNNENVSFSISKYGNNGEKIKEYKINSNITVVDKIPNYLGLYFNDYISFTIIVSEDMYNNLEKQIINEFGEYKNNSFIEIYIKSEKNENVSKEIAKIINETVNSDNYNVIDITSSMKEAKNLVVVIGIFLYGFISLVTLIGVTSVFNTINTSIALRRKEFAVLRSIGLTPKGFNKMIRFESILYGLKALLYGLPVSLVIVFIFHKIFGNISSGQIIIPWNAIIISIVGVFIITFLSMMYASKKIKKENILDAIREENI